MKKLKYLSIAALLVLFVACVSTTTKPPKDPTDARPEDPYAKVVFPPPPDDPKIRLVEIISGRADVEAESKLKKSLLGASPMARFDNLKKPFAVEYDRKGRLLVTDTTLGVLLRFDRKERKMDVFGTTGAVPFKLPLGIGLAEDGTIYVADAGQQKVIALDEEGSLLKVYGKAGELTNPTDVAVSPDGKLLYVSDSKAHRIVVLDRQTGETVETFGKRGNGEGEFAWPTSLVFDREGNLYVVDQINSRLVVFDSSGEVLDEFGQLGVGFGSFVRPKDVAVDDDGWVYVTDAAFNNAQIFDDSLRLLTFVGDGGTGPGRFRLAMGIAVRGEEFAMIDQLGHRVQIFRYLGSKRAE